MSVEIREIPPYRVAYVRHVGPYGDDGRIRPLWIGFERWIRARGLRRRGTLTIGIGHDAPKIAAPEKLRYDACFVVDAGFKADRFVNIADLPAEMSEGWEWFWTDWLPNSGYQPEDRPCLELRQDFETLTAGGNVRCELCLPVGPL